MHGFQIMYDGPIPYATKQSVGDTQHTLERMASWWAAPSRGGCQAQPKIRSDKLFKLLMRIKVEMRGETETSPQRRRQHAFTSGGTNHAVNRGKVRGMEEAPGPLPTITSTRKSSIAIYNNSSAARGRRWISSMKSTSQHPKNSEWKPDRRHVEWPDRK